MYNVLICSQCVTSLTCMKKAYVHTCTHAHSHIHTACGGRQVEGKA